MNSKTITIPNISCDHCVNTVKLEVGDIAGVANVTGDAATKQVVIEWQTPATWTEISDLLTEIEFPAA